MGRWRFAYAAVALGLAAAATVGLRTLHEPGQAAAPADAPPRSPAPASPGSPDPFGSESPPENATRDEAEPGFPPPAPREAGEEPGRILAPPAATGDPPIPA